MHIEEYKLYKVKQETRKTKKSNNSNKKQQKILKRGCQIISFQMSGFQQRKQQDRQIAKYGPHTQHTHTHTLSQ